MKRKTALEANDEYVVVIYKQATINWQTFLHAKTLIRHYSL